MSDPNDPKQSSDRTTPDEPRTDEPRTDEPTTDEPSPFAAAPAKYEAAGLIPRPTGVTVTGVLCLLGGIMGALVGLLTLLQLIFGRQLASVMVPSGPAGEAQRQMNSALQGVMDKYLIPNLGVAGGGLILSACLIVGGIALFRAKQWTPTWLRRTFLVMIVFELIRQSVFALVQMETYPVMQDGFAKMAEANQGSSGSAEMMKSIQQASMIIGFVFWGGWTLVKILILTWGFRYLGRQHVRDYLAQATAVEADVAKS
ncbi:MAG: hypothetical protein HKN47_26880 [Pirellulaceae bacterium]|nr:hypothetical protein [Pirellulaceae bacterium]